MIGILSLFWYPDLTNQTIYDSIIFKGIKKKCSQLLNSYKEKIQKTVAVQFEFCKFKYIGNVVFGKLPILLHFGCFEKMFFRRFERKTICCQIFYSEKFWHKPHLNIMSYDFQSAFPSYKLLILEFKCCLLSNHFSLLVYFYLDQIKTFPGVIWVATQNLDPISSVMDIKKIDNKDRYKI